MSDRASLCRWRVADAPTRGGAPSNVTVCVSVALPDTLVMLRCSLPLASVRLWYGGADAFPYTTGSV